MIGLLRRMLYMPVFHLDANLINARQKLPAVNQLEAWRENGLILINMSSTAHGEAQAGDNPQRTRKANEQIFTATEPIVSGETYRKVEAALFPSGAQTESQRHDVSIVCEANHYAATLVTSDGDSKSQPGGILGNREKLKHLVEILSPEEAVEWIKRKIQDRDSFNRQVVAKYGCELPDWTGKD